jgi:protein-tyrosine phosphatase
MVWEFVSKTAVQIGAGIATAILLPLIWLRWADVRKWYSKRYGVKTIIYVSYGGTCRDPMAAAVTKQALGEKIHNIKVLSAGLVKPSSTFPHPAAQIAVNDEYDFNLLGTHQTQQLNELLVRSADLILCTDADQVMAISRSFPEARGKVQLLKEFFGSAGNVTNPWRENAAMNETTVARYKACLSELRSVIEPNIGKLTRALNTV